MNGKLKLNDLLGFTQQEISRIKIRLNTNDGNQNPLDVFKKNPKKLLDWNYWNNKQYKVGQISIGLVDMGNDKWLFFTVGEIKSLLSVPINSANGKDGVQVDYQTMSEYNDLYGRVIVRYHNQSQQLFRNASLLNQLEVSEILPDVFTGFDFPGYDNVSLSYAELETIVNGQYDSYRNALAKQKAIYLQTDKATGKLYVGSATAQKGMLLSRWSEYIKNGHGGNRDLIELVNQKGFAYIKENFQYTIIENFNSKVDDHYVLERESYWKEVLQTRKYGYNAI